MDFNDIWKARAVPGPDVQALYSKIKNYRTRRLRRLVLTNICLVLTSVFIASIGFWIQPERLTTWAGILVAILAMVTFLLVYNRMIPLYRALDDHSDSHRFMDTLLTVKKKEAFLNRQMMNLYFFLLSLGLALYMYEYVIRMELKWAVLTYTVMFAWIGFNWWVIRPRQIRKEQEKISSIITRLEEVQGQFKG
ncbi:MAG: hypothetical protein KF870_05240 [Leadbetterella sp.]|nr:hypothetical protein [Leadbetterella sp.]